jgi:hypothetical protein
MENNVLLVNSFLITLFVMIVDQMFIANNLTIFQPLSDQYFDSTPISIIKQELDESPINDLEDVQTEINQDEEEQPKKKKSKKLKKSKKNKKTQQVSENKVIDLNDENIYYNNEDEMYYNQYYDDSQQQRPERYVDDTYGGRGYNFQEPVLNNDYNFSIDAFNS